MSEPKLVEIKGIVAGVMAGDEVSMQENHKPTEWERAHYPDNVTRACVRRGRSDYIDIWAVAGRKTGSDWDDWRFRAFRANYKAIRPKQLIIITYQHERSWDVAGRYFVPENGIEWDPLDRKIRFHQIVDPEGIGPGRTVNRGRANVI